MEVVADTVGSIGVLIAGIVTVTTHWPYADVVVAVLVALWVLPRAISLARAALRILSESSPQPHRRRRAAHRAVRGRRRDRRPRSARVDAGARQGHGHRAPDQPRRLGAGARRGARGAGRARAGTRDRPGRAAGGRRRLPGCRSTGSSAEPELSACAVGSQSSSRSRQRCVFVGLPDRVGRPRQRGHAAQESPVGFVVVRHRAEPLPAVAAQLIQTRGGSRCGRTRTP